MSILDDIERTGTDMSSVFNKEELPVVFSPRKYNRCVILYHNENWQGFDTSMLSKLNAARERLSVLLDAVSIDWQIGLCTENEMMSSHCFCKYLEHTKRLQLQHWTHVKPVGAMMVILFNIDNDFVINRAVRTICNFYAILHRHIICNKKHITCLMYSQDEDHPGLYRLCCDDFLFLRMCYDIMTGTYEETPISEGLMYENIGGAMTGDFGSCTLPETCEAIYKRYCQLNEMHSRPSQS